MRILNAKSNLLDKVDGSNLPIVAKNYFKTKLNEGENSKELTKQFNEVSDKLDKGAVVTQVTDEGIICQTDDELNEELSTKTKEYNEAKNSGDLDRLNKAKDALSNVYNGIGNVMSSTIDEVKTYGVDLLNSKSPESQFKAAVTLATDALKSIFNVFGKVGKFLSKGLLKAASKGVNLANKVSSKVEDSSVEFDENTLNELDFNIDPNENTEPVTDEEFNTIVEESNSDLFKDVEKIIDWESAFKYGYAKLQQVHGANYDESIAKSTLEGLKEKYPDNPMVVVGALKYGGKNREENIKYNPLPFGTKNTPESGKGKPILTKIPKGENPIVKDPEFIKLADEAINMYPLMSRNVDKYLKEFNVLKGKLLNVISRHFPSEISKDAVTVIVDERGVELGLSTRYGWVTMLDDGSILSPNQGVSDYDMYRSTTPINWYIGNGQTKINSKVNVIDRNQIGIKEENSRKIIDMRIQRNKNSIPGIKLWMQIYPDGSHSESYIVVDEMSESAKILDVYVSPSEPQFDNSFTVGEVIDSIDFSGVTQSRTQNKRQREKVDSKTLQLAKDKGVVQLKPNGSWGIISIKAGEWWDANYQSEESARAALKAYHASRGYQSKVKVKPELWDKAYELIKKLNPSEDEETIQKLISFGFGLAYKLQDFIDTLEEQLSRSTNSIYNNSNLKPVHKEFKDAQDAYEWMESASTHTEDPIATIKIGNKCLDVDYFNDSDTNTEGLRLTMPDGKSQLVYFDDWKGRMGEMFDYINDVCRNSNSRNPNSKLINDTNHKLSELVGAVKDTLDNERFSERSNNVGGSNPRIFNYFKTNLGYIFEISVQGIYDDEILINLIDTGVGELSNSSCLYEIMTTNPADGKSTYWLGKSIKDLKSDLIESIKLVSEYKYNLRNSNSTPLSQSDVAAADKYVKEINDKNFREICKKLAADLGEKLDLRKVTANTIDEFRDFLATSKEISDRLYAAIDYLLASYIGYVGHVKRNSRSSNSRVAGLYQRVKKLAKNGWNCVFNTDEGVIELIRGDNFLTIDSGNENLILSGKDIYYASKDTEKFINELKKYLI